VSRGLSSRSTGKAAALILQLVRDLKRLSAFATGPIRDHAFRDYGRDGQSCTRRSSPSRLHDETPVGNQFWPIWPVSATEKENPGQLQRQDDCSVSRKTAKHVSGAMILIPVPAVGLSIALTRTPVSSTALAMGLATHHPDLFGDFFFLFPDFLWSALLHLRV
jgi:hypothetical protein